MEKKDECKRHKWNDSAVSLLVSIWSHDHLQKKLRSTSRNQSLWESVAGFMSKRGYHVTGLQCKTKIKNMISLYYEAEKKGDPSLIEPYYQIFEKAEKYKKKENLKKKIISTSGDESDEDFNSTNNKLEQTTEDEYSVEYLEPSSALQLEALQQAITSVVQSHTKTITKALETQTKTIQSQNRLITNAFETQTRLKILEPQTQTSPKTIEPQMTVIEAIEKQTKAIESQTEAITRSIIETQSQIIELIKTGNEQMKIILADEREHRRELDTRLDVIMSKLDEKRNYSSNLTYILGPPKPSL